MQALFYTRGEAKQNDRKLRIIMCGWVRRLCGLPPRPIVRWAPAHTHATAMVLAHTHPCVVPLNADCCQGLG